MPPAASSTSWWRCRSKRAIRAPCTKWWNGFPERDKKLRGPIHCPARHFHCGRAEARSSPWRAPRSRFRATLLLGNRWKATGKRKSPQPRRPSRYQGKDGPFRLFPAFQRLRGRPARFSTHSPPAQRVHCILSPVTGYGEFLYTFSRGSLSPRRTFSKRVHLAATREGSTRTVDGFWARGRPATSPSILRPQGRGKMPPPEAARNLLNNHRVTSGDAASIRADCHGITENVDLFACFPLFRSLADGAFGDRARSGALKPARMFRAASKAAAAPVPARGKGRGPPHGMGGTCFRPAGRVCFGLHQGPEKG